MTRAEVVAHTFDKLNTTSRVILSDEKVDRAFNRVMEDWSVATESLSSELSLSVIAGQSTYLLAAASGANDRAFKLRRVRYRYSPTGPANELVAVSIEDLPEDYDSFPGVPRKWASRGTVSLLIWPEPSGSVTNGFLIDTYNMHDNLPEDATGDAVILQFPADHRRGLILGLCAELCDMNREDPSLYNRYPDYLAQFMEEAKAVRGRAAEPGNRSFAYAQNAHQNSPYDKWSRMLPSDYGKKVG